MDRALTLASMTDVPAIVALRCAVAARMLERHGRGHWAHPTTAKAVAEGMRRGRVYVLRDRGRLVACLRLVARRPPEHRPCYTACRRPLYLFDMAVAPERQRQGLGRRCLEDALRIARAWPADALRLDAYDAPAGAGAFYERCGFRESGRRFYFRAPVICYEFLLRALEPESRRPAARPTWR